ncbi:MAG: hypothetical protein ACK40G_18515 [Cytophagaceae bacterium]
MEKLCPGCNQSFRGRSDKKYCSDLCRNAYHNMQTRIDEKFIYDINKILRKNRLILKKLNPRGKCTVRKENLTAEGFDFKFYTHQYKSKKGNVYNFCYDYGYLPVETDKILIVLLQPYMEG